MSIRKTLYLVLIIALTLSLAACFGDKGNVKKEKKAKAKPKAAVKAPSKKIPSSSKFAKIKIGMPRKQVIDLIGYSKDTSHHTTGKSYIPFYHGRDRGRRVLYYKGEGRLYFSTGNDKLVKMEYDPSEDGYH